MNGKKNYCGGDMDILATYTGESWDYKSARLMYIEGKQDARPGTVGTLVTPQQARGINIDSGIPDVKTFSFIWRGKLRQLLVKIRSVGGGSSTCTVRLLEPRAGQKWESLSGDVTLLGGNGNPILFNPHALAEWGDVFYLIDYESRSIVILGADELEGMAGNYVPIKPLFSLEGQLPENAKGQALIVLGDQLIALYLNTNLQASAHQPGVLCRMNINSDGKLSYDTKTTVGLNPQAIIPVNDGAAIQLLIPAIGGPQSLSGTTNGTDSNICCVPAQGTWPASAQVLITGAASGTYDIHAVAAGMRGRSNMLYILTQMYDEDDEEIALWKLYRTTVGQFLDLAQASPTPTLTNAAGLEELDEGVVTSIVPGGLYFWDLLYAQTPEVSDAGDLLWAALGTPILVTRAAQDGYGAPDSEEENAYVMFGFNGGNNVNAIDLTIEVINQAERGRLSLKRGLYGSTFEGSKAGK
jgi:hypothetical protein